MPTIDQLRTAIKNKVGSVANIGVVHDYERFAAEQAKFREFYVSGSAGAQRVLGWNIRRIATRESFHSISRWMVRHTWNVRGFMSIDDASASEKTFDNHIEAIRDVFRADPTLTAEPDYSCVVTEEERSGVQVVDSGPVMFAGVLCHAARLELISQHLI